MIEVAIKYLGESCNYMQRCNLIYDVRATYGNDRSYNQVTQLSARPTVDMSESKTLTAKAVPQANGWKKEILICMKESQLVF